MVCRGRMDAQERLLGQRGQGWPLILCQNFKVKGEIMNGNEQNVVRDFFVYSATFSSLANGTSATQSINIQADSDFIVQKMAYFADIAAAVQTDSSRVIPLCTIQITDQGSGRNLMDSPQPVSSICGTGQIPFILPNPKLFLARSTVVITAANFSAGTTYNLRISFIGHKKFRLN